MGPEGINPRALRQDSSVGIKITVLQAAAGTIKVCKQETPDPAADAVR